MYREYKDNDMKNKVNNFNAYLEYLKNKAIKSKKNSDWSEYRLAYNSKEKRKKMFETFNNKLNVKNSSGTTDFNCYKNVMNMYESLCGRDTERDHEFFGNFYNYCSMGKGVIPAYKVLYELCRP